MSEIISIPELVAVCVEAAERACSRIRSIHATGNLKAIEKGDGTDALTGRPMADTQTEADRQSEKIIFSVIKKHYPELRIIGEEESSSCSLAFDEDAEEVLLSPRVITSRSTVLKNLDVPVHAPTSELTLFVDPLDGTNEFVSGHLHCVSVLIGIARNGIRLAGVIGRPFPDTEVCNDELMYALVGQGVFVDHCEININKKVNNLVKITTTLKRTSRVMSRIFELMTPVDIVKEGGAGWKFWLVASGRVDCYQYARPGTKKWDALAGDAVISTLGGAVTDACGRPIVYSTDPATFNNEWGIIASVDRSFHFSKLVVACHAALCEDPGSEWPKGLEIPPLTRESNL